jgi:hypothetical protein
MFKVPAIDKRTLAAALITAAGKKVPTAVLARELSRFPGVSAMAEEASVENLWEEMRADPRAWKLIEPYQNQLRAYLENLIADLRRQLGAPQ